MEALKTINSLYCNLKISDNKYEIREKENQLIDALEAYLKEECYESYIENNLKNTLIKARENDLYRSEMINIIKQFIFE